MKAIRKIVGVSFVALATLMLLAHNLVPHHHNATIVPCTHTTHVCSHPADRVSVGEQCSHTTCTLIFEFLGSSVNLISHAQPLPTVAGVAVHETAICGHSHQRLYSPREVPLLADDFYQDLPRRGPPVVNA